MSENEAVLTAVRGRTLIVTLNRPDQRNAINGDVAQGIAAAMDQLDDTDELSVGVITGAGRGFCAGMDLKAFAAGGSGSWIEGRGFAGITERAARKPLIAALEGFAVAGGLEVALSCDIIVAAKGTKLGVPEVKRGLVATGGALRRLPQRVPRGKAFELALTGDLVLAEEAVAFGLVDRLAEPGAALDEALVLAEAIAVNGPLALAATKEILTKQAEWSDEEFWPSHREVACTAMESEDAIEGSKAFAEKRDPVWKRR